jgi:hypothetical protein
VIVCSQALLDLLRPQSSALRGRLFYRYERSLDTLADLAITVEVFAEDRDRDRVRVGVEVPGPDPLDQGGNVVQLRAGTATLSGATDETGQIDFAPVPLTALPCLRVTVQHR